MQTPSETGDQKAPPGGNSLRNLRRTICSLYLPETMPEIERTGQPEILLGDREKCNVFIQ